jgi:hypothetical protein
MPSFSVNNLLDIVVDSLKTIDGVQSCKIGLEVGMTANDYPMIRVVPTRIISADNNPGRRTVSVIIYVGVKIFEGPESLAKLYAELLDFESAVRAKVMFEMVSDIRKQGFFIKTEYVETIFDEDRVPLFKLIAIKLNVTG